ncbi:sigma-70 family RNA polymerase sigma factor [Virgibacillus oceani]|uniref:DNA-directed RNA polymerase sigma-70 factor n=1 Tax=Virgibacillus oceani TaxID=1479511 RepID=A0A917HHH5_9BACI|nr:sigma-70 family RNA polymerase sigma factor [Virgibacillus oceani]GGG78750.1 DNA-directed RNA polymerase sigma-70 factor [Virgibacillus oceani]
MDQHYWLTEQFEENRAHMQAVAYNMLGSVSYAEDAVQESWIRLKRSDMSEVENIRGWLTTVVSRICLDMLRSRKARHEKSMEDYETEKVIDLNSASNPEYEAMLADSVGLAMLVVLDKLNPVERITFVLHDIFAVPFAEIASIVGRTETATRQMAHRARRRVQGAKIAQEADLSYQRQLVDSFLAAARTGKFEALLEVLDPDVVLQDDRMAIDKNGSSEIHGARAVAKMLMAGRAKAAHPALVNGSIGVAVAPSGNLLLALVLTYMGGKIVGVDVVRDPECIQELDITVLSR